MADMNHMDDIRIRENIRDDVREDFRDNNKDKKVIELYSIDLLHIVRALWHRAWVIILACIIFGGAFFSYAYFGISPKYSSSVMLYVNNGTFNVGDIGLSISASQLSAAQSLAKTYTVLLKNRTTLQMVADKDGLDYTWRELYNMISASPVDETEVLSITVTCEDPYHAQRIAEEISIIFPERIRDIIDGSTMQVVDYAEVNLNKVSPSISRYTAVGMIVGLLLSVAVLSLIALRDNTIHDEEFITENYDYPILARIPNLYDSGAKKGKYYSATNATKKKE